MSPKGCFSNTLAVWVKSQFKYVLHHVLKLHHETPRVSIGYSPKSQAKQATQEGLKMSPKGCLSNTLALLAVWVNSQLKYVLHHVLKLHHVFQLAIHLNRKQSKQHKGGLKMSPKGCFSNMLALLASLAVWVNSQLKHVLHHVIKLHHEIPSVSTGYSPKSQAKNATHSACVIDQSYLFATLSFVVIHSLAI